MTVVRRRLDNSEFRFPRVSFLQSKSFPCAFAEHALTYRYTLHPCPYFNEPIAEETGDDLYDCNDHSDNHAQFGILAESEMNRPYEEPENVEEKKWAYVQMEKIML